MSSMQQYMLVLTIFLYPYTALSHVLYLLPQAILLLLIFFKFNYKTGLARLALAASGLIAVVLSFAVEVSVVNTSYDLPSKFLVNVITILIIASDINFVINKNILKQLRIVSYVWLFTLVLVYAKEGVSSLDAIWVSLNSGDSLDSSQLYGAAAPAEKVFLTKNISSMFMVAVFSIYLYFCSNFNKKVGLIVPLVFLTLTVLFLSRQGIVAFLVILFLYNYKNFNKFGKTLTLMSGVLTLIYIFSKLFNLSNSEDGASQRLQLWIYFFNHFDEFWLTGMGQNYMSYLLFRNVGIDNFHMFFMNQIGAYGLFHFISFSIFLFIIYFLGKGKNKIILVAAYFLNVMFQTFGYEYGNLILFMIILIGISSEEKITKPKLLRY